EGSYHHGRRQLRRERRAACDNDRAREALAVSLAARSVTLFEPSKGVRRRSGLPGGKNKTVAIAWIGTWSAICHPAKTGTHSTVSMSAQKRYAPTTYYDAVKASSPIRGGM